MNKNFKILVFVVLSLVLVEPIFALTSDLKESYNSKETIIVSFKGPILEPINFKQVEFLRGHVSIPLEYDIKKLGENYYLWAIAPENAGNYSLVLKEVATLVDGVQTKYTYYKNFSVLENKTEYTIKPGFVSSDNDFSINVFLYKDEPKKINLNFPESREVILEPGNNKIDFSVKEISSSGLYIIQLGSYSVPVEIKKNDSKGYIEGVLSASLFFEPIGIRASFNKSSELNTFSVKLMNKGKDSLKIGFQYNESLFEIDPLPKTIKSNQTIELAIKLKNKINQTTEEKIVVSAVNETAFLPIFIEIIKEETNKSVILNSTNDSLLFCPQMLGVLCEEGTFCKGEVVPSRDGDCCLGTCEEEKSLSTSKIVSFLIFGIIIIIIVLVWMKYKKTGQKNKENLLKINFNVNKKIP